MKIRFEGLIKKYSFEVIVLGLFLIYVALCLTPSSYGLVLNIFGLNGEGLLWGKPRAIRSDEWVVWTPYFQAIVNNDFARFNENSLYHEDFRGFSALPIHDWAMLFKPLLWPFLIMDEAYAFSLHHALIMVAFILGWKFLLDSLLPATQENGVSGLFSLLLFFSGFVQGWWTTLGPLLALTPWLFITLLWCEKISWIKVIVFCYVSVVWILSHTYPPIIISSIYLAFLLVICFKKTLFNIKTMAGLALAGVGALAITYIYLADAIHIVSQTVYPGQRISNGGELPWLIWLSVFVPYITHSNYEPLLNTNICELGVVTSLLPTMALIFINYKSISSQQIKTAIYFIIAIAALSLWMLAPIPEIVAKVFLLDRVPGARLLWVLGLVVNLLALYLFVTSDIKLTIARSILFLIIIMAYYSAACYLFGLPLGKKSAWELLAGVAVIPLAMYVKKHHCENSIKLSALLIFALAVNVIYFGAFNPGQSAKPIFSLKNSPALNQLKDQQGRHSQGWLVAEGYPGAVLQGLGFNSVTHVLMTPKLEFFKALFPEMDSKDFDYVFNRYAHIQLADDLMPFSPQADVIRVPRTVFGVDNNSQEQIIIESIGELASTEGGYIDLVEITDKKLVFIGWGMFSSNNIIFFSNYSKSISTILERSARPDVITALNNKKLSMPGFKLTINIAEENEMREILSTLCLYVKDDFFGVKKIQPGNSKMQYKCK